jgi:hypothetical protein
VKPARNMSVASGDGPPCACYFITPIGCGRQCCLAENMLSATCIIQALPQSRLPPWVAAFPRRAGDPTCKRSEGGERSCAAGPIMKGICRNSHL